MGLQAQKTLSFMNNNYLSPNHLWFLPQFKNYCVDQSTINAELNSNPLIQQYDYQT